MLPHLPALRLGKPYTSLDQVEVKDCRSGTPLARISQVNAGIIRRDAAKLSTSRAALKTLPCEKLITICKEAADLFLNGTLPLGDLGHTQSPTDYVHTLSATSGLPHSLVRRNSQKIASALSNMRAILNGLTRNLDLHVLDSPLSGVPQPSTLNHQPDPNASHPASRELSSHVLGARLSFFPVTSGLGLVMPSNSPGVNSLWLPAIPLKTPVLLKPGREEPWTPYRLIQALIAAGCPPVAFGFYPTDHEGGAEILKSSGRALVFGDKTTTDPYANSPAIQIHGPGFSKILIGDDQIERWPDFIDVIVASILDNGGRSCINASAVLVPRFVCEIADALARKIGPVLPLPPDDENAKLATFANPKIADAIDDMIEQGLCTPGAVDVTTKYRNGPRKLAFQGAVYLRPTIVLCDSMAHPLANREFLFPYASVLQVPQPEMLRTIGPSLVVTAITQDAEFRDSLLECPQIDRLNLGPISTMQVSWDQPHEGNLFEFLYRRRALELA